jgi:hypothetical protein
MSGKSHHPYRRIHALFNKIYTMSPKKFFYLLGFLFSLILLSSCYSSQKSRRNIKRCNCPRFSEMKKSGADQTFDWVAHHGTTKSAE